MARTHLIRRASVTTDIWIYVMTRSICRPSMVMMWHRKVVNTEVLEHQPAEWLFLAQQSFWGYHCTPRPQYGSTKRSCVCSDLANVAANASGLSVL